ncbi:MAG: GldG family protein [Anaerolineae bacterium]|nr:GldG family protein [Anaerolineae bacterium]
MNPKLKKFAPIGLYLAAAAAIAAAGIYIVMKDFNLPLQISLGLIVIGLAIFTLLNPERARQFVSGKQARYSSNLLLLSISVIGILVVINYLGYKNTKRWDLTETQEHTLAPETIDTLEKLQEPVTVQAFYTSRISKDAAQKLLDSYRYAAKGKFEYQFIDPEANPLEAQAAKVTRDGTIVLKMGTRQEQVTYPGEQDITAAIIRLANPGERTIYFLVGHGEVDIETEAENAYTQVRQVLENKNYTTKTLNLLSSPTVPDNARAIVIAGPKKPLTEKETQALDTYVQNGGSLVILTEPREITFQDQKDYLAEYLDNKWGIQLDDDIIIDPNVNPPLIAIANKYDQHPITEKLMNVASIFPTSHSIQFEAKDDQIKLSALISTSDMAWGETNFEGLKNNQVSPDQGTDYIGPLTIAVVGENAKTSSRLVVIGDSDFASNRYYQEYGNSDLIVNSIDWASGQEDLISLTPKKQITRILLPPTQITLGLILLGSVFVLPGIVVATGISTWISRRRRG